MSKIIKINLSILFHYYRNNKEEMTALRIWFIARHILDTTGEGRVNLKKLSEFSLLSNDYLKNICKTSKLFRAINSHIYYCSLKKNKNNA